MLSIDGKRNDYFSLDHAVRWAPTVESFKCNRYLLEIYADLRNIYIFVTCAITIEKAPLKSGHDKKEHTVKQLKRAIQDNVFKANLRAFWSEKVTRGQTRWIMGE